MYRLQPLRPLASFHVVHVSRFTYSVHAMAAQQREKR
jgi:hypothetical protein